MHARSRWHVSLFWIVLVAVPLCAIQDSAARFVVDLSKKVKRKEYPIAIPNFKAMGGVSSSTALKASAQLRNDFKLSGVFRVISPSAYLEKAPRDGLTPGSFDFKPWQSVGAAGLVKGSLARNGSGYKLSLYFYEVGSGKLAKKEAFNLPSLKNLRYYVHYAANRVYKLLIGEKGFFTSKVAFIRNHLGRQELYVMDFDGKNQRRLTNNGSVNALPAFSPNGRYIAYTSWKRRNPDLYVYDLRTGKERRVSSMPGLNTGAAWHPSSNMLAFSASRGRASMDIYLVSPFGGTPRRLTKAPRGVRNLSPSWSPNGKQIAFVSTQHGSPQVFIMNASTGGNQRRLTKRGKYNQSPKWSPLGDWILFTGRDERNKFDLFLVSPKTGQTKRLTQGQGQNMEAAWSPNGRNIIFTSTRRGVAKLFIMTDQGRNPHALSFRAGQFLTPTWSHGM